MNIMEELALQMVRQFFVSMKSCIELVLSKRSSFKFARTLIENQIENIHHTGGSDQAKAHLALVEQLRMCLKELRILKNTNMVNEARLILNKLLAAQERKRKENDEQMAKEASHFNEFTASYQRLVDDSRESEVIIKNANEKRSRRKWLRRLDTSTNFRSATRD